VETPGIEPGSGDKVQKPSTSLVSHFLKLSFKRSPLNLGKEGRGLTCFPVAQPRMSCLTTHGVKFGKDCLIEARHHSGSRLSVEHAA